MTITKVGRVIIPVSDQDTALEFYSGTLGFEVVSDMPFGDGNRWLEVAPPGSEARIALQPPPGGVQAEKGQSCVCFSTNDLDADHAALKESGVDVDELMGGDGGVPRMFFFRDPDGNNLLEVSD